MGMRVMEPLQLNSSAHALRYVGLCKKFPGSLVLRRERRCYEVLCARGSGCLVPFRSPGRAGEAPAAPKSCSQQ